MIINYDNNNDKIIIMTITTIIIIDDNNNNNNDCWYGHQRNVKVVIPGATFTNT